MPAQRGIRPFSPVGSSVRLARMEVRTGMSRSVVTVTPGATLHDAARAMAERKVGAAVGSGQDPNSELVRDHLSPELTFAAPEWSLERAAEAMVRGGFRHLVVVDG